MNKTLYEQQTAVETNVLYMVALALDLLVRDNERRMAVLGAIEGVKGSMKRETKFRFSEYTKAVKRACLLNEQITQDIYDVDAKYNFKNVDLWHAQANELARFILLFADKSDEDGAAAKIESYMRSFKGADLMNDEFLKTFYLKKL